MSTKTSNHYNLFASVWLYPGESGNWHFVTVPKEHSQEIKQSYGKRAKGWGSLPVTVTIGETSWNTSIFPDAKTGTYLLPIKTQVRSREGIFEGDTVELSFTVLL